MGLISITKAPKKSMIGSNEDRVILVDIALDKNEPKLISEFFYDHQYTHQAWLTTGSQICIAW